VDSVIGLIIGFLGGLVLDLITPSGRDVRCPRCGLRAMRIKISEVERIWRCRGCEHEWPSRRQTRKQEQLHGRLER
jgi:hypothetical protein